MGRPDKDQATSPIKSLFALRWCQPAHHRMYNSPNCAFPMKRLDKPLSMLNRAVIEIEEDHVPVATGGQCNSMTEALPWAEGGSSECKRHVCRYVPRLFRHLMCDGVVEQISTKSLWTGDGPQEVCQLPGLYLC